MGSGCVPGGAQAPGIVLANDEIPKAAPGLVVLAGGATLLVGRWLLRARLRFDQVGG